MLRVALIGFGKWGRNYTTAINESGYGYVSRIFASADSPHSSSAPTGCANLTHSINLESISEVFSWGTFDAAIVATHPPATEEYSLKLLNLGISVMAEKPFTFKSNTLIEVQRVIDQNRYKPTFLINHQHLFSHAIDLIRNAVGGSKLLSFKSKAGNFGPHREYTPLCDYGPHGLALLSYLTESQLSLSSYEYSKYSSGVKEDIQLRYNTSSTASLSSWNNCPPKTHRIKIETENNKIIFDDFDPRGRVIINGDYLAENYTKPLTLSVRAFLERVSSKRMHNDSRFGVELALRYTQILSEIRMRSINFNTDSRCM